MLNRIEIIGNLGKDPVTSTGTSITKFSVAVNRTYKDSSGEKVEETDWFNVVTFGKLADIAEKWLTKGSKVYISGRLVQRKYTDREGINRLSVEINANDLEMLGSKRESDPFAPEYEEAYQ